jgi:hypothetical protein
MAKKRGKKINPINGKQKKPNILWNLEKHQVYLKKIPSYQRCYW